jgi:hypothetical protein
MKTRTMWTVIIIVAVLALMAGVAGALPDRLAPEATVAESISYQGQLSDASGTPLSGTYPMRFQVWSAAVGGTTYADTGIMSINVNNGLFNAEIAVSQEWFDGRELWLRIYVDGDWLTPRQELLPVPYALSLRPGAQIEGNYTQGYGLEVDWLNAAATGGAIKGETATGVAVFGRSPGGFGLFGYSDDNYAVYGLDTGSTQSQGYGGYFHSWNGVGVYGYTAGLTTGTNPYAPGVYGHSVHGAGVYGSSEGSLPAILGIGFGPEHGVEGASYDSIGVGVKGMTRSSGAGVWGESDWIGVYAESFTNDAIYASTGKVDNNYGLNTPDNIIANSYHVTASIMQVVQNGGEAALEPGDLAAFSGMAPPLEQGGSPVVQVTKATPANSQAVAGVVYRKFDAKAVSMKPEANQPPEISPEVTSEGSVAPGEHLLLVIQGPAQAKADALGGAIQPGNLLSAVGQAGHVSNAPQVTIEGIDMALPGTVVGKALEPLAEGQKLIYIFVTLQ